MENIPAQQSYTQFIYSIHLQDTPINKGCPIRYFKTLVRILFGNRTYTSICEKMYCTKMRILELRFQLQVKAYKTLIVARCEHFTYYTQLCIDCSYQYSTNVINEQLWLPKSVCVVSLRFIGHPVLYNVVFIG